MSSKESRPRRTSLLVLGAAFLFFAAGGVAKAGPADEPPLRKNLGARPEAPPLAELRQWFEDRYRFAATYRFFDRGYARMHQGDWEGAAADFRSILERDPDNPIATIYLSRIEAQRGQTETAIRLLESHLSRVPDNRYARLALAFLYLDGDSLGPACRQLEAALPLYQGEPKTQAMIRANLAEAYLGAGNYAEALPILQTLQRATPSDPLLAYKIGLCLRGLGRYGEAETPLQLAVRSSVLTPVERASSRLALADSLWETGQKGAAAAVLEELLRGPDDVGPAATLARQRLVEAYSSSGRHAEALEHFWRIPPADRSPLLTATAGYSEKSLGRRAKAVELFHKALTSGRFSDATADRIRLELAGLYVASGDKTSAERILRQIDPSKADRKTLRAARVMLANIYYGDGRLRDAVSVMESLPGRDVDPLFLAELQRSIGQTEAAEALFRQVSENPEAPEASRQQARLALGDLFLANGNDEKATKAFEAALEYAPGNAYAATALMEIAKWHRRPDRYLAYANRLPAEAREDNFGVMVALTVAELGDTDTAIRLLDEALPAESSAEKRSLIHEKLGYLYLRRGEVEPAVDHLGKSLDLSRTTRPDLLRQLSAAQIHAGRCDEAIPNLEKLCTEEDTFDCRVRLARCSDSVGDARSAAENYQRALQIRYEPETAFELAAVQEKTGGIRDAGRTLEKLLERGSLDSAGRFRALLRLSKNHGALGDRGEQKRLAAEALRTAPTSASGSDLVYVAILSGASSAFLDRYGEEVRRTADAEARSKAATELAELYQSAGNSAKAIEFITLVEGSGWPANPGERRGSLTYEEARHLRFRRGFLLYEQGRYQEAAADFVAAWTESPTAALYAAYAFEKMGKPGLAIDCLERRVGSYETIQDADLLIMVQQLAFLYYGEGQVDQALARADSALEREPANPRMLLIKARCLNDLGRNAEAFELARSGSAYAKTPGEMAGFQRVLGDAARAAGLYRDSNEHYEKALGQGEADAAIRAAIAQNALDLDEPEKSLYQYEQIFRSEPGNLAYLPEYAFALARVQREDEGYEALEKYLSHYPDDVSLQEEAGYLALRAARNPEAVGHLRRAIDLHRSEGPQVAVKTEPPGSRDRRIAALKESLLAAEQRYAFSAYLNRPDLAGNGSSRLYRGVIPGQVGADLGWRPPGIGFRDYRILEVAARVLGSFEDRSWAYDRDSTQLGIGLRYKPLSSWNLWISAERLVRIGDRSEDNWLLRGMISQDWGREPPTRRERRDSGRVYVDLGAFLEDSKRSRRRTVLHAELTEGLRVDLHPAWALVPHAIVDAHGDSTGDPGSRYLEGGLGVELLGWLHETPYAAPDWRASLFAQYKWGAFSSEPPGESGRSFHGPVVGVSLSH